MIAVAVVAVAVESKTKQEEEVTFGAFSTLEWNSAGVKKVLVCLCVCVCVRPLLLLLPHFCAAVLCYAPQSQTGNDMAWLFSFARPASLGGRAVRYLPSNSTFRPEAGANRAGQFECTQFEQTATTSSVRHSAPPLLPRCATGTTWAAVVLTAVHANAALTIECTSHLSQHQHAAGG
jgi:hypothetical protein